jgi:hypothetical protein
MERWNTMKKVGIVLLLLAVTAKIAMAQDAPPPKGWDTQLVWIDFHLVGGVALTCGNETSFASLGIGPDLRQRLSIYGDSKVLVESYLWLNTTGNVLRTFGLLAMAVGLSMTLSEPAVPSYLILPTRGGLLLGLGLFADAIGEILVPLSLQKLTRSANAYNRQQLPN